MALVTESEPVFTNKLMETVASEWFHRDLARSNLFYVDFHSFPSCLYNKSGELVINDEKVLSDYLKNRSILGNSFREIFRRASFQVKGVSLPGTALTTTEANIDGALRTYAYDTAYASELQIEFYVDPTFDLYKLFELWIKAINPEIGIVEYYDNYISDYITIYSLARDLNKGSQSKIMEVYPVSIEPIEYTAGTGDVLTFSVSFKYYAWTTDDIGKINLESVDTSGALQKLKNSLPNDT